MKRTLVNSVIEQLGHDYDDIDDDVRATLSDIASYGIGGFAGFVYYCDTVKFFDDNRSDILAMASNMADDFGTSTADMVAGFGCLTDDSDTRQAIDAVLMNIDNGADESDITQVKNALAWFAGEEAARAVTDA